MNQRTILAVVVGLAVSVLVVGGLAFAGGIGDAPGDPALDASAGAREAYSAGLAQITDPDLRRPEPAPQPVAQWQSAARAEPAASRPEVQEQHDAHEDDHDDDHDDGDHDDDHDDGDYDDHDGDDD